MEVQKRGSSKAFFIPARRTPSIIANKRGERCNMEITGETISAACELYDWIIDTIREIWHAINDIVSRCLIPARWLHLARYAKRARVRKMYKCRIAKEIRKAVQK